MNQDEKEAAIIRRINEPSFAHAENVLLQLRGLEQQMTTNAAVDLIYRQVVLNERT